MKYKFNKHQFCIFFLNFVTLICCVFQLYSQNKFDSKFKNNASKWYYMEYKVPKNYFGMAVKGIYIDNKDFIQSSFIHEIKHKHHDIVIAFALLTSKPDNTSRGIRIREVFGSPDMINLKAINNEADTTLSKVKYIDTVQFKKLNADRGVTYNMKMDNKYKHVYTRCKKVELYKDNVGRAEILFFYNKGDDALVDEEIEKTWGMLKFKP
jgi:hypothetical protein